MEPTEYREKLITKTKRVNHFFDIGDSALFISPIKTYNNKMLIFVIFKNPLGVQIILYCWDTRHYRNLQIKEHDLHLLPW